MPDLYSEDLENITQDKEYFSFSHLGLIALCAVFLVSVAVMKNGFSLSFAKQQKATKTNLTYAQVLAQVRAERGAKSDTEIASKQVNDTNEKLAMVDPNFQGNKTGQVAGASINSLGEIVDLSKADSFLQSGSLNRIQILLSKEKGPEAVQKYANALQDLEAEQNVLGSMQNLASEDKTALKKSYEDFSTLVANLLSMEVPEEVSEYHRLKIFFYGTEMAIADYYLGNTDGVNFDELSTYFFSATDKMEKIRADFFAKYKIQI